MRSSLDATHFRRSAACSLSRGEKFQEKPFGTGVLFLELSVLEFLKKANLAAGL